MSEETTSEQLAEIEGQAEDTPATEYTPPEGWRVVRFGEQLLPGDVWVSQDGTEQRSDILHWDASAVSGGRCIRRIEPQPEPQPRPAEYTPPEGWRVLAVGEVLREGDMWVWPTDDQLRQTVHIGAVVGAKQRYIRPIEPQREPESDTELQAQVAFLKGREVTLGARLQQEKQVTTGLSEQLETVKARINDLETINNAQLKALTAAGKENTALRNQLEAVKAELATQAETIRRLQIELDAAQQVPPAIADRFKEGWNQGTARAIETVLEWLQPIRAVDSPNLANETLQHLPQIMRHLTGLDSHAID